MDNPVFVDEEDIRKNVTDNLDLIDFNWFKLTTDPKKEAQFLIFTMVIDGLTKKQAIFLHQKL